MPTTSCATRRMSWCCSLLAKQNLEWCMESSHTAVLYHVGSCICHLLLDLARDDTLIWHMSVCFVAPFCPPSSFWRASKEPRFRGFRLVLKRRTAATATSQGQDLRACKADHYIYNISPCHHAPISQQSYPAESPKERCSTVKAPKPKIIGLYECQRLAIAYCAKSSKRS